MSEHADQVALMDWCRIMCRARPELNLIYAIPNGGNLPYVKSKSAKKGSFSPQRLLLRKEGMRPGVPDLCLPVARHGFHSLYIEMKFGKNKPTEDQIEMINLLREYGNKVEVCYGTDEAISVLVEYLDIT